MSIFPQLAQVFPLILAPGIIALARKQKAFAKLDGPVLVGLAVIGAAVLWTLLLAMAYEETITRSVVARGVLLGLVAVAGDTWATRKSKPQEEPAPAQETPSAAPTVEVVPPDMTPIPPTPDTRGLPAGALSADWGPR